MNGLLTPLRMKVRRSFAYYAPRCPRQRAWFSNTAKNRGLSTRFIFKIEVTKT